MAVGVDTCLNTIVEVIDKIKDTAASHQRAFVVEVMGRHSGYLALMSAMASGAEVAVIPEMKITLGELALKMKAAFDRGLPVYYERLGFLRTEILPGELVAKIKRVRKRLNRDAVGMVYDRRIERLPSIADVYRARHLIERYLPRTPLLRNLHLSRQLGCEAYIKYENLLPIGAFKVRGGVYLCAGMSEDERARGIVGASTGNHGQSLAYGAHLCRARCVIVVPEEANPLKVESMQALGAVVQFSIKF